jgi:hypothetical protein
MNDDAAVLFAKPTHRSALARTLIALLLIAAAFAAGLATGRALDRAATAPQAAGVAPHVGFVSTASMVTGTGPDLIAVADAWKAGAAQGHPAVTGTGPGLVMVAEASRGTAS